jgi:L-iditol 2-dehydrogenase
MKAVRIYGPRDLRIEDRPVPTPGPGDILVKIAYIGICGTDIEIYMGELGYIKQGIAKLPMIPGHEWTGVVCEVGEGVDYFKAGDEVCGENGLGCLHCERCFNGEYHLCPEKVGVGIFNKDGAFAEYLVIPARWAHKLTPNISLEAGALVEPACVGCYAVETGRVNFGDTALVFGDGPIGQYCVQFAKAKGAAKVILIGSHQSKMDLALTLGADCAISRHTGTAEEEIRELTHGKGIDVILESSGNGKALSQAVMMLRKGGRMALVSHYQYLPEDFNFNRVVSFNLSLYGVVSSPGVWDKVIRMVDSGQIKTKPLIAGVFPMEEAEARLNQIMKRELVGVKFLLKP